MLIRIKFDGKSRKLSEKVSTISDLKAKINELFGIPPLQIQIVYKDCDGEMVDVVDDEDLKNCYNEVHELNQTSLTFIITNNKQTSRSHSRENRSKNSGEESTGLSGPILPGIRGSAGRETPLRESESAELSFSHKGDVYAIGARVSPDSRGRAEGSGFVEQISKAFMDDVLQSIEGECPGLCSNPRMLSAVLNASEADLETLVKRHYHDVVKRQPELLAFVKGGDDSWLKGEIAAKSEARKEIADSGFNKPEGNAGNVPPVNFGRPSNSRGGNFEFRGKDRNYPQSFGRQQQTSYYQDYSSYKTQPRDAKKYPTNDFERGSEDPATADILRKLCQKFPQKSKAELRAIIQQNPDNSVHQLESLITQSRKAKSKTY